MGHQIPGPICSHKLGSDWIDEGTLSRSRSGAPGPLGMLMSMVIGAAPPSEEAGEDRVRQEWRRNNELEKKLEAGNLERDTPRHIAQCIAKLRGLPLRAWRSSQERDLILTHLMELNKTNKIKWVDQDDRGSHMGGEITIRLDLHWGSWEADAWMKSAPVLVHEGTHGVWNKHHFDGYRTKWKHDHQKSYKDHPKGEDLIAEETYAWENELKIFEALQPLGLSDPELERRLGRKSTLGVEMMVRGAYDGWMSMDGIK